MKKSRLPLITSLVWFTGALVNLINILINGWRDLMVLTFFIYLACGIVYAIQYKNQ